ncbi:hypothetical protein DH09_19570 [Bacillaceae bacterium JMAK1]|nr:hypothetical protein DH09_19570 [Bacillaceae bacterium JMAK1]
MEQNKKVKKPFYKRWWFFAIVAFFVIGMFSSTDEEEMAEDDVSAEEASAAEEPDDSEEQERSGEDVALQSMTIEYDEFQDSFSDLVSVHGMITVEDIPSAQFDPFVLLYDSEDRLVDVTFGVNSDEDEQAFFAVFSDIPDGEYTVKAYLSCLSSFEAMPNEFGNTCSGLTNIDTENDVVEFGYLPYSYALYDEYYLSVENGSEADAISEVDNFLYEANYLLEDLQMLVEDFEQRPTDELANHIAGDMTLVAYMMQAIEGITLSSDELNGAEAIKEVNVNAEEWFTTIGEELDRESVTSSSVQNLRELQTQLHDYADVNGIEIHVHEF